MRPKPLLLIILDAFGISTETQGNPVAVARTQVLKEIETYYPFILLQASGVAVGLPWGEAGNSEVGHLTMGAGRVLHHHLPRIISSIHDGSFFDNPRIVGAANHVKTHHSRLHIAGLVSSGSVHSYIDHLYAMCDFTQRQDIESVSLHIFTDGKDAPPHEGANFIKSLENELIHNWPHVRIASVIGRFYAMDRDEQWNRIQTAYELLTQGKGMRIQHVSPYLEDGYQRGGSDEFIEAASVRDAAGNPVGLIQPNDALIFFNFREDSMRELTHAFADEKYDKFLRQKVGNIFLATMTDYDASLASLAAFPSPEIKYPLAQVLGEEGLTHLHIAETEKYAHVTYFFNGGKEAPFIGEERRLIHSLPRTHVDEVPEMRAREITSAVLEGMDRFDVTIVNFANADMVGHSGNFGAVVRAVEVLDESLGQLVNAVMNSGGVMVITGDHGGVEMKQNLISGEKRTEHSINPVPLYLVGKEWRRNAPRSPEEVVRKKNNVEGILTDIAPTILELLDMKIPREMTGTSLLFLLRKQVDG